MKTSQEERFGSVGVAIWHGYGANNNMRISLPKLGNPKHKCERWIEESATDKQEFARWTLVFLSLVIIVTNSNIFFVLLLIARPWVGWVLLIAALLGGFGWLLSTALVAPSEPGEKPRDA